MCGALLPQPCMVWMAKLFRYYYVNYIDIILKFYMKIMYILLSNTNIYYFVECNKSCKKTSSLNSEAKGKGIYCCQVIWFKALPHVE